MSWDNTGAAAGGDWDSGDAAAAHEEPADNFGAGDGGYNDGEASGGNAEGGNKFSGGCFNCGQEGYVFGPLLFPTHSYIVPTDPITISTLGYSPSSLRSLS